MSERSQVDIHIQFEPARVFLRFGGFIDVPVPVGNFGAWVRQVRSDGYICNSQLMIHWEWISWIGRHEFLKTCGMIDQAQPTGPQLTNWSPQGQPN